MLQRGLVKCSSLFFIVFLMCPRRIRLTAIGKQNYFHARRSNDFDEAQLSLRTQPFECCNFSNDGDIFRDGVDDEPGFDLTDNEIRKFKLWPKGIIPYYIDAVSFNDKVLRDRIRSYLNSVNVHTRLSFLELPSPPKDDYTRWVFFANRRGQLGCADHSILHFTNVGVQHVNLGYDCLSTGAELAEAVLAIAGVPAQHNAPYRDELITIVEENIMPEKRYLFRKLNDNDWLFHGMDYDITSAGHYHPHKYSVNGQATIDFKNERPLHVPVVEPRRKPNKYLGLPEETNESNEDLNFDKGFTYDQNNGDGNGDDKGADGGEISKQDFQLVENAGTELDFGKVIHDDYKLLNATATRKIGLKSHPLKLKHNSYKVDPLLYLSDYQTDGRRRKASRKNTTLKAVNT